MKLNDNMHVNNTRVNIADAKREIKSLTTSMTAWVSRSFRWRAIRLGYARFEDA